MCESISEMGREEGWLCVCVCEKLLQYKTCVNTPLLLCLLVCVHELMVELVGKGRRIIVCGVWCVCRSF